MGKKEKNFINLNWFENFKNSGLQSIIIDYNGFLCKTSELEIWIKIRDYNQL